MTTAEKTAAVFDERKRALALKLSAINRKLTQQFNQSVEASGMSRAKWTLIAAVNRIPGGTQREIATVLDVTEVTAGRLIDRLCEDGYLERLENPEDRRSYKVYLKDAAYPVLEKLGEIGAVHIDKALAGLSDEDLAKFDGILDVISGNIGAIGKP